MLRIQCLLPLDFLFGVIGRGRARIQFHQHVALFHVLAFNDVHSGHDAGGWRGELRPGRRLVRRGGRGFHHPITGNVTMQRHALKRAGLNGNNGRDVFCRRPLLITRARSGVG